MSKIAVFVEGRSELIFVRNFLRTWYRYDSEQIGLDCYVLNSGVQLAVDGDMWTYGSEQSQHYYQLIQVGNDNTVLSRILSHAETMHQAGFELIIGLRDMFQDAYHAECKGKRRIDSAINQLFINSAEESIRLSAHYDKLRIHFAIMEVEAWFIALLTPEEDFDPETDSEYYHPYMKLSQMRESYGKHRGDVEAITMPWQKEDYECLLKSGRCRSFKSFVASLVSL